MTRKELSDEERETVGARSEIIAQLLVRLGRWYIRAVRVEAAQNEPAEQKFIAAFKEVVFFALESGALNNKS